MDDREKLNQLIGYCTLGNRICPQPNKWNEFWHLLGCPRDMPPFVLSGWAFSTSREKRSRFREQLEYASGAGLLEAANGFILSLGPHEWHTCEEVHLDWSYGNALIEENERHQEAVARAANALAPFLSECRGHQVFSRDKLSRALLLYHLVLDTPERWIRIELLREQTEKYANLENEEFPLLDGDDPEAAKEVRNLVHAKLMECTLAEILCCIDEAGLSMDAGCIEEFVDDIFEFINE